MADIIEKLHDIFYNYVGGDKIISKFIDGDKIKFATDFKGLEIDGDDLLIKSSSGTLTIQDFKNKLIDIVNNTEETAAYLYATASDGVIDGRDFPVLEIILGAANLPNHLIAGDGGSSLIGNGGNNTLQGGAGIDFFIYKNGNDIVTNYSNGDVIKFDAEFKGIGISENNFAIGSNNGAITIRDAVNKIIDVADGSGNIGAHVYFSTNAMQIDGRGIGGLQVIIGGGNGGDVIYADNEGSSLWGGDGNFNDSIFGGAGFDEIFYTTGNGNDNISNVSSEDIINLLGIGLNQISAAMIQENGVNLNFTDGGSLNISGRAGNFILEGKTYRADYENKTWLEVEEVGSSDSSATLTRTEGTNNFTYSNGDGDVVIADYVEGQDVIKLQSGLILNTSYDGDDVIFMVGGDYVTVKNAKGKNITITDAFGNTSTANYTPSETSEKLSEDEINEKVHEFASDYLDKFINISDTNIAASADSVNDQINELIEVVNKNTENVIQIAQRVKTLYRGIYNEQERKKQIREDTALLNSAAGNIIDAIDEGKFIENTVTNPVTQATYHKLLCGSSGALLAVSAVAAFIATDGDLKKIWEDEDLMDSLLGTLAQVGGIALDNAGHSGLSKVSNIAGILGVSAYNAVIETQKYSSYLENSNALDYGIGAGLIDATTLGLVEAMKDSGHPLLVFTSIALDELGVTDMVTDDFKMKLLDALNAKSYVKIDDLHGEIYTANKIAKVIDASSRQNEIEIRASTVDNTIIGGRGNDTLIGDYRVDNSNNANSGQDPNHIYIDTAHGSDTFVYFNGGGYDVINDYRSGEDIIKLSDCQIISSALNGDDVILNIGEEKTIGSITVKNAKDKKITIEDKYGNIDSKVYPSTEENDNIPSDAYEYNGHSYSLFNINTTWTEAESRCESMGGHLVTVSDGNEQLTVARLMASSDLNYSAYWLGGFKSNSQWQWITKESFEYENFYYGEPNGSGNYLQIYASDYYDDDFPYAADKWDDTTVDGRGDSRISEHGFICEWDYMRNSSPIPSDAYEYNGHSYYLFNISTSWTDAKKRCESMSGHLVTITDNREQTELENFLKSTKNPKNFYYAGGYLGDDDKWHWVSDETFDYTNWGNGEPDNAYGENRMMIYHHGGIHDFGEWNDVVESGYLKDNYLVNHFGFICEWDYTRSSANSADIFEDTNFTGASNLDAIVNLDVNEGLTENFTAALNSYGMNQTDSLNSIIAYSNG